MAKKKSKKVAKSGKSVKAVDDFQEQALTAMSHKQLKELSALVEKVVRTRQGDDLAKIPKSTLQKLKNETEALHKLTADFKFELPLTVTMVAWVYFDGDEVVYEFEADKAEFIDDLVTEKMVHAACPAIKERLLQLRQRRKDLMKTVKWLAKQHDVQERDLLDEVDVNGDWS